MSANLDIKDIKRFLEDANLYEKDMTEEQMTSLYAFINNSDVNDKTVLEDEDDNFQFTDPKSKNKHIKPTPGSRKRRYYQEVESPKKINPKNQKIGEKKDQVDKNSKTEVVSIVEPREKVTEQVQISKEKGRKTESKTVKKLNEKLKSQEIKEKKQKAAINPQYTDRFYFQDDFEKLPMPDRITAIANYHLKLAACLYKQQRRSLNFVEWGKPISTSAKFNGRLEKNLEDEDDEEHENHNINNNNTSENIIQNEEVHKNDNTYDMFSNTTFGADTEIEYVSKSGRTTKRKVYMNYDDDDDLETEIKKNKVQKKIPKSSESKEAPKTPNRTPSRPASKTKSRSEMLYDKLTENEKAKKQSQIEQEKFEATLRQESDEDDYDLKITSSQITDGDDGFGEPSTPVAIKKRVIPPVVIKRGYRRRQGIQLVQKKVPDEMEKIEIDCSPTNSPTKTETMCPICSKSFSTKEIANHASNCGLSKSVQIENSWDHGLITCELCDKVFEINTDYEVHVHECRKKKRR